MHLPWLVGKLRQEDDLRPDWSVNTVKAMPSEQFDDGVMPQSPWGGFKFEASLGSRVRAVLQS